MYSSLITYQSVAFAKAILYLRLRAEPNNSGTRRRFPGEAFAWQGATREPPGRL
jgi:hypothetical protein